MSFRALRERKRLSQERLAEMSGLSLRTIQRVDAGHRVSYATLRALAATFEMDVDLLERELYAMNTSTDDFVEIPKWVRRLNGGLWNDGPRPSRRQAHVLEAIAIGCGVIFLAMSFFVPAGFVATIFRVGGFFSLACGYGLSVTSRIVDTYKAWPSAETSLWQWRPVRTLRGTVFDYAFVALVLIVFFSVVFWLVKAG
jgi:transcriptional regulator with XRE-family HTH domain